MTLQAQREAVLRYARKLTRSGLTTGTGGNLSLFDPDSRRVAVTPSGIEYDRMQTDDIVALETEPGKKPKVVAGRLKPSSELLLHLRLYETRGDIRAVVHTHSSYATTLACMRREIPPVHYLIGFCGDKVPLAPYALYGSDALAQRVAETIGGYNAVLMAHHGLIAVGTDLKSAFNVAESVEFVARIYYQVLCAGTPKMLSPRQMAAVLEKFPSYGQSPGPD